MKVITANVNGIRSAARKGFFTWLSKQGADVVCLQETKAQQAQLDDPIFSPQGYHAYYADAQKKGYSGVAIYCRRQPDRVIYDLGWDVVTNEGRYVQVDFGRLSVASVYLPSGSSGEHRQAVKFEFLEHYMPHLRRLREDGREYILCGDWNIAHRNIDLKNWKSNQKNSGFLPQERAWLDELFNQVGYVDAFRALESGPHHYTWWSNRGRAYENNVGWRIDYQIITPNLKDCLVRANIDKTERFSDHAPLVIEYALGPMQALLL